MLSILVVTFTLIYTNPRLAPLAQDLISAAVSGPCRARLLSPWPYDWRPQKSHDKITGNTHISAS